MGFVVVAGGFTLDDTVLLDNRIMRSAPGGNLLYGAIGAKIWHDNVGLFGIVGCDYPEENLAVLIANGFDLSGLTKEAQPCLKMWALHEGANERQLIYKLNSGSNEDMDPDADKAMSEYVKRVTALHISAVPYTSQRKLIDKFKSNSPCISMDTIRIPGRIDPHCFSDLSNLSGVNVFLPSLDEINTIWPNNTYETVMKTVCSDGQLDMVIKLGDQGCVVFDRKKQKIFRIPVFKVDAKDTTGAGDSFCGGFIAGMDMTGDVLMSAMMGSISSSFLIQEFGAMHAIVTDREEAYKRIAILQNTVQTIN